MFKLAGSVSIEEPRELKVTTFFTHKQHFVAVGNVTTFIREQEAFVVDMMETILSERASSISRSVSNPVFGLYEGISAFVATNDSSN